MIQKNLILKNRKFKIPQISLNFFLMILVLIIIVLLIDANFRLNKKRIELSSEIRSLETELRNLENKKREYESAILKSKTNEFWEEKLREQGYRKPGESVFVVVFPQENTTTQFKIEERTWWQSLLEKFRVQIKNMMRD